MVRQCKHYSTYRANFDEFISETRELGERIDVGFGLFTSNSSADVVLRSFHFFGCALEARGLDGGLRTHAIIIYIIISFAKKSCQRLNH